MGYPPDLAVAVIRAISTASKLTRWHGDRGRFPSPVSKQLCPAAPLWSGTRR